MDEFFDSKYRKNTLQPGEIIAKLLLTYQELCNIIQYNKLDDLFLPTIK